MDFYCHKSIKHKLLKEQKKKEKGVKITSFSWDREQLMLGLSTGDLMRVTGQQRKEEEVNLMYCSSYDLQLVCEDKD